MRDYVAGFLMNKSHAAILQMYVICNESRFFPQINRSFTGLYHKEIVKDCQNRRCVSCTPSNQFLNENDA